MRKNWMAMVMGVFMATAVVGCTPKAEAKTTAETVKETEMESAAIGLPSPFVDCKDLEKAAQVAGFSLDAPKEGAGKEISVIQAVDQEMIQVFYGEEDKILLRKGIGDGDISGDYNQYSETQSLTVGDISVTAKGEDGKIMVALWTSGDYTYAIDAEGGLDAQQVCDLVSQSH